MRFSATFSILTLTVSSSYCANRRRLFGNRIRLSGKAETTLMFIAVRPAVPTPRRASRRAMCRRCKPRWQHQRFAAFRFEHHVHRLPDVHARDLAYGRYRSAIELIFWTYGVNQQSEVKSEAS
jgi:hypothetical protein